MSLHQFVVDGSDYTEHIRACKSCSGNAVRVSVELTVEYEYPDSPYITTVATCVWCGHVWHPGDYTP